jgi:hypothetical protein
VATPFAHFIKSPVNLGWRPDIVTTTVRNPTSLSPNPLKNPSLQNQHENVSQFESDKKQQYESTCLFINSKEPLAQKKQLTVHANL